MSWFKVDDNFHSHPKVKSIPRKDRATALGLWVQAGSWAAQQLTDGFVPDYMIEEFGVAEKIATALGTAALWVRSPENDGWQFKDWSEHQPSRAEVQAKRKASAERVRAYRERKNGSSNAPVTHYEDVRDADVTPPHVTTPRPDPTRPDPTVVPTELPNTSPPTVGKPARKSKPMSRLSEDFTPTDDAKAELRERCPGITASIVDPSVRRFMDHYTNGKGRTEKRVDWNTTWCNWIERDWSRTPRQAGSAGGPTRSTTDDRVNATLALRGQFGPDNQHRLEIA